LLLPFSFSRLLLELDEWAVAKELEPEEESDSDCEVRTFGRRLPRAANAVVHAGRALVPDGHLNPQQGLVVGAGKPSRRHLPEFLCSSLLSLRGLVRFAIRLNLERPFVELLVIDFAAELEFEIGLQILPVRTTKPYPGAGWGRADRRHGCLE
jgi:hypothetical protein